MDNAITVRWRDWSGQGLQHLVLREAVHGIVAEAVVIAEEEGHRFAAHFAVTCDWSWRTRTVEAHVVGDERRIALASDGAGHWRDGNGQLLPELDGAIDTDLTVTPYTNTLPIRRLDLRAGQSVELRMAYVVFPELAITASPQRYTCLEPMRRYRYESLDGDFTREIEVDAQGLVVTYPGLFQRL
jgi:uncharacterized protein